MKSLETAKNLSYTGSVDAGAANHELRVLWRMEVSHQYLKFQ